MAKSITWDSAASDDLYALYQFHSEQSENYADELVDAIFDRLKLVEQFPRLGRVVPELNLPSVREVVVEKYRIIYFVSSAPEIRILAVRHSAKPLNPFPMS